jgi:hypothetical protein
MIASESSDLKFPDFILISCFIKFTPFLHSGPELKTYSRMAERECAVTFQAASIPERRSPMGDRHAAAAQAARPRLSHRRHQAHILQGKKAFDKNENARPSMWSWGAVPHPNDCLEFLIFKISS